MNVRDERFRSVLRAFVIVMAALALAAGVVGCLPGKERYFHGFLVERIDADDGWYTWCLVAPGILVWRRPTVSTALLWSGLTWFYAFLTMALPLDPEYFQMCTLVTLWPREVVISLSLPVLLALWLGLPVAVILYSFYRTATTHWDVELPDVPTARVVGTLRS